MSKVRTTNKKLFQEQIKWINSENQEIGDEESKHHTEMERELRVKQKVIHNINNCALVVQS
jgi:hypothetical protein